MQSPGAFYTFPFKNTKSFSKQELLASHNRVSANLEISIFFPKLPQGERTMINIFDFNKL